MGPARRDKSLAIAVAVSVFLLVVAQAAFLAIWMGSWGLKSDSYPTARDWWLSFALPRGAWSLVVGVPAGAVVATIVGRKLGDRR